MKVSKGAILSDTDTVYPDDGTRRALSSNEHLIICLAEATKIWLREAYKGGGIKKRVCITVTTDDDAPK